MTACGRTSIFRYRRLVYGRTDQTGNTAYVENDPAHGPPLMLCTSSRTQALHLDGGIDNPVALIADSEYRDFAYTFDPYEVGRWLRANSVQRRIGNRLLTEEIVEMISTFRSLSHSSLEKGSPQ